MGDNRVLHYALLDLRWWQVTCGGVGRFRCVVEAKFRIWRCERQVGIEEGFDGTNVFPVVVVKVRMHVELLSSLGDNFGAKVVGEWVSPSEKFRENALLEDIDAHGSDVRLLLRLLGRQAQHRCIYLLHNRNSKTIM